MHITPQIFCVSLCTCFYMFLLGTTVNNNLVLPSLGPFYLNILTINYRSRGLDSQVINNWSPNTHTEKTKTAHKQNYGKTTISQRVWLRPKLMKILH